MPTRKYLNKEKKKDASAEDEWAHLTGIEEGPKMEVSDASDVQDRNIFIRDKQRKKGPSVTEQIQEELVDAGIQTRGTDQYVRLVNAIFDKRLEEIEKMKKRSQLFEDELGNLTGEDNSKTENLNKIPLKDLKSKDIAKLIKVISQEKGNTISRLEHFKSEAHSLEKDLLDQDKRITELDTHLKEKMLQENEHKEKESGEIVEDELKILQELYGMDKLSQALKKLKGVEK